MTPSMKRLMILGAGPNQLPAIQRAIDLGFYVITADYLPQNVGHRFSHQSVNCSTIDQEGILRAAKELDIDGIMTMASDVATPTVGYVAEHLGLAGGFTSAANILSNKASFRAFQREHGFDSPKFLVGKKLEDIEEDIATLSPPLIFKPVDTSGSRGISRVNKVDPEACLAAFESAQEYSRSKTICVEEFVKGVEVGGDGFIVNGRLVAVITRKYVNGFVVTGHSLPTNVSIEDQQRVITELATTCSTLGYTDGPLNFDVMISPGRVSVMEISPRLGGNGIPAIIERATDLDFVAATIGFALDERLEFPKGRQAIRACGSWVFGSDHSGRLEAVATEEEMKVGVPEVFEYVVHYHIGEQVPHFIHGGTNLGYALFDCPGKNGYARVLKNIQRTLRMRVT